MHGFALNITRKSLPPFLAITPCGIQGVQMTCLEDEMSSLLPEGNLLKCFGDVLQHYGKKNLTGLKGIRNVRRA